jgi:hypothetical protein
VDGGEPVVARTWHDILPSTASYGRLYEGVIKQDATSVNDLVLVTIAAFDEDLTWGPAPFMPRVDDDNLLDLPQEGDLCVVGLAETDTEGEPSVWIISYTGVDL